MLNPTLRNKTLHAALQSVVSRAQDRETYLRLAETLTAFLARLRSSAENIDVPARQRIVQLLVKEVLVGDDTITIRHSIPMAGKPQTAIKARRIPVVKASKKEVSFCVQGVLQAPRGNRSTFMHGI